MAGSQSTNKIYSQAGRDATAKSPSVASFRRRRWTKNRKVTTLKHVSGLKHGLTRKSNPATVNHRNFNASLQTARQLSALQKYEEALGYYTALVGESSPVGLWGEYSHTACLAGDIDLAEQIWEKLRRRQPNDIDLLSRMAGEYQFLGLHAKARALYAEAATIDPRHLAVQLKLAWLQARTSGLDDARATVNNCLKLDPGSEQARFLSAHLDRRENRLEAAERQFRSMLVSPPRHPHLRYSCYCELARISDRAERFEEAMAWLEEGKKLARQDSKFEENRKGFHGWHANAVRQVKSLPKTSLDNWGQSFPLSARAAAPPLAFLSGSARSGTTLLERILDAHPGVAACDESAAFSRIFPGVDVTAAAMPAPRLNFLRQRYVTFLTKEGGPAGPGKILLDKNPSRTVWLPALLRVFPELRVLIALRDPRDVIVSLYFQDHTNTNGLTMEQLAEHYFQVMEAWLAVREWDGLAWLETRYEDIVADMRKEASRVMQFLRLEWHENQAKFHEANPNKPVLSTNYNDVTQPVYTRSVGRWRAYEKHLAPILPALEPYCRSFNYT